MLLRRNGVGVRRTYRTHRAVWLLGWLVVLFVVLLLTVMSTRDKSLAVIPGEALAMRQVDSGAYFSCSIAADNWLYCWGEGTSGQLGNAATSNSSVPVTVSRGSIPDGATIRQVSAGSEHACALASDNWVYCWGDGSEGQLGRGSLVNSSTPVAISQGAIPAGATIRQVAAGGYHTCAIASNNQAYCWGNNADGNLGDNSTTRRTTPVAVNKGAMPSQVVEQITAGDWHTCAIASDKKPYCWGESGSGQVGDGTTTSRRIPVAVVQGAMPSGSMVRQLSGGGDSTCAIASNNRPYCWGDNSNSKLGDNSTTNRSSPVAVAQGAMPSDRMVVALDTGDYRHTCAIASNGKAYCWGRNANGDLGDGTTTNRSTPVAVAQGAIPSGVTAASISLSGVGACMISSESKAYCWGYGAEGEIGNGSTAQVSSPAAVNPLYPHIAIDQSVFRAYKMSFDAAPGEVLADTNNAAVLPKVADSFRVRAGITNREAAMPSFTQVAAGYDHTCAASDGDALYCWGSNFFGQLGDNSTTNRSSPTVVAQGAIPGGSSVRQLVTGMSHTCALMSDGWVYCWGWNIAGQLGNNSTNDALIPIAIQRGAIPVGATVRQIAAGYHRTCVIASDNKAYCWGDNSDGALGDGTTTDRYTPVAVAQGAMPSGSLINSIAVGSSHVCAIANNNKAYCWGWNGGGQLGDNSTTSRHTPVAVAQGAMPSGALAKRIFGGQYYTCAIANDNKAYCWGSNGVGQLGDNSTTDRYTPVAVVQGAMPSGSFINDMTASNMHTCAIANDNKSYCWGVNDTYQLGDGTNVNRPSPVAVSQGVIPGGTTTALISAGYLHACSVVSDGYVYCWGGILGNGTVASSSSPVAITQGEIENTLARISASQLGLRLEYAQKGAHAACSDITAGWQPVTSSSLISFGGSPPSHNSLISSFANDPIAPTVAGMTHQTIVSSNSFSNASAIAGGKTGLWDFVLQDRSSLTSTTFCVRMKSVVAGQDIDQYSVFPEITTSEGAIGVQFVDGSGNPLSGSDINTMFDGKNVSHLSQTSSAYLVDTVDKQLNIHNSQSYSGWTVSLAATGGDMAKWQSSGGGSYNYNAGVSTGQLTVGLSGSSIVAIGDDPSGNPCSSTSGITHNTVNSAFLNGSVSTVTLLSGSSESGFNCTWRLRNISLSQTIPAFQSSGEYNLDLTATIVAN